MLITSYVLLLVNQELVVINYLFFKRVFRWFEHMERMNELYIARSVGSKSKVVDIVVAVP